MASHVPTIGSWYLDPTTDNIFEVVAIDDHTGSIEIQYDHGDIDELDLEQWFNSTLEPTTQPQDPDSAYRFGSDEYWDDDSLSVAPWETLFTAPNRDVRD